MNYEKINKFKFPAIAASVALVFIVGAVSFFYGVKQSNPATLPDGQITQSNQAVVVDNKIKGNRKSKIYHMKGCPNYDDLKETNIIWFKTADEAEARGFRAAKNC